MVHVLWSQEVSAELGGGKLRSLESCNSTQIITHSSVTFPNPRLQGIIHHQSTQYHKVMVVRLKGSME